jgi:hypothetical protein
VVATAETSLCDELGRPRNNFAMADLFGVRYLGRPKAPQDRPPLDANSAIALDESYWKDRSAVARLSFAEHDLTRDERLGALVPTGSVTFRGPIVCVSRPGGDSGALLAAEMDVDAHAERRQPAIVCNRAGSGRVVYFAAAVDAALWSYAYPYQRRLLARALEWAARDRPQIVIKAPMCVQATWFLQENAGRERMIVHLFNGVNTTAHHGLPATDVPLREETLSVHGITVWFEGDRFQRFRWEPDGASLRPQKTERGVAIEVPPLALHAMLVAEPA